MDLYRLYRASVNDWVGRVSSGITDWSAPTPCADWDVRTLVNHVVGEDRWTKPLVDGRTIAEVGNALDGDLLGDDPVQAASAAAAEALESVARRLPEDGTVQLSYGEEDIAEYVRQLLADHLVHGWDLAAATGQDRGLDPDVVAEVSRWFRDREEMYRAGGGIGPRPDGANGGDAQSDLLIAFGRDPEWRASPTA